MHKSLVLSAAMLACSFHAAGAEASSVCPPLPPQDPQEEVARFAESDITAKAATEAIAELETKKSESLEGQQEHLITGDLRLIEGYLLKYRAESDGTPDATARFCRWLETEGHWPE